MFLHFLDLDYYYFVIYFLVPDPRHAIPRLLFYKEDRIMNKRVLELVTHGYKLTIFFSINPVGYSCNNLSNSKEGYVHLLAMLLGPDRIKDVQQKDEKERKDRYPAINISLMLAHSCCLSDFSLSWITVIAGIFPFH